MKNLLIINQEQFGYHLDTYYYCKYLKPKYNITYICWNYDREKIIIEDVKIKYISRSGSLAKRNIRFIKICTKELKKNHYHICFIKYFRGSSILKSLFPTEIFIFDVRSGSVDKNKTKRLLYNSLLKFESLRFKYITVISESLRKKLKLSKKKSTILPLGADIISNKKKPFNKINLIYVGTLTDRNIENTIYGFNKFYKEFINKIDIKFTIIGDDFYKNEMPKLKALVYKFSLNNVIKFTGYIHHKNIKQYFDNANFGVSYVPINDFFNVQPPTKTFEYILSGMFTIATNTYENNKIINSKNGILINDNSESFYNALKHIYYNQKKFNSEDIRNTLFKYTWKNIATNILMKYLEQIIKNKKQLNS